MNNTTRLDRLTTIWPANDRPTDPRAQEFYDNFISRPALPHVLAHFGEIRASHHYATNLAAGLVAPPLDWRRKDIPAWYSLDEDAWHELTRRELDGLRAHQRALGETAGWEVWLAEGADWRAPLRPSGLQDPPADQRLFDIYYRDALDSLAQHRRGAPWAGWRARTAWRPGMTLEEEKAFDRTLLLGKDTNRKGRDHDHAT
jgi:hypothetical protein